MSDPESYELITLIKKLNLLLSQNIDLALKPYGLARTQYVVLYRLRDGEPMPTKRLLEKMNVEGATLSALIDALAAKGLVARTEYPGDRRSKLVTLTAAGRKVLTVIPPPGPIMEQVMLAGISSDDTTLIKAIGQHMADNLTIHLRELMREQTEGE